MYPWKPDLHLLMCVICATRTEPSQFRLPLWTKLGKASVEGSREEIDFEGSYIPEQLMKALKGQEGRVVPGREHKYPIEKLTAVRSAPTPATELGNFRHVLPGPWFSNP